MTLGFFQNSELIEKLLDSCASTESENLPEAEMEEAVHEALQESLCATDSNVGSTQIEHTEEINQTELNQPKSVSQVNADGTFWNAPKIESNINQAKDDSSLGTNQVLQSEPEGISNVILADGIPLADTNEALSNRLNSKVDPCDEIILERRKSRRISAAHLKKTMTPIKPSLLAAENKENVKKGFFNRNNSHIPTLKERVSKLASIPSASTRRPSIQVQQPKPQKFDLKESLKRPLGYKPYTGPIKKSTI